MDQEKNIILNIDQENIEKRLDVYLFENFNQYSRTFFKNLILEENLVFVNDKLIQKPSYLTKLNDKVEFFIKAKNEPSVTSNEDLAKIKQLNVKLLYTHKDFLIIYKPAYLNTHKPDSKNKYIALTDWLLVHFKELTRVGDIDRPGIVHRLDKDTSGLLIIPRNPSSHIIFSDMFKNRNIEKTYIAVVQGNPDQNGQINLKIRRHELLRNRMMADKLIGRDATTYYKVIKNFNDGAILEVNPITGRTHQIRVHLASINYPIIGDNLYGFKSKFINRQALHAYKLSFIYKDKYYMFLCDIPWDIKNLISNLKQV